MLHCLPATRAEDPVIAHGTVLGTPTLIDWTGHAGLADVEVLDVDHDFWRFYRLRPARR